MASVIRFTIAAGVLVLAVVTGYFSADTKLRAFSYGASVMLLLPLTLVLLLDAVRHEKLARNQAVRVVFVVPVAAIAFCSVAIGVYLMIPLIVGAESNTWLNVAAGVSVALIFIAFGIKLLRELWCR